jgi:hypothetical protein
MPFRGLHARAERDYYSAMAAPARDRLVGERDPYRRVPVLVTCAAGGGAFWIARRHVFPGEGRMRSLRIVPE